MERVLHGALEWSQFGVIFESFWCRFRVSRLESVCKSQSSHKLAPHRAPQFAPHALQSAPGEKLDRRIGTGDNHPHLPGAPVMRGPRLWVAVTHFDPPPSLRQTRSLPLRLLGSSRVMIDSGETWLASQPLLLSLLEKPTSESLVIDGKEESWSGLRSGGGGGGGEGWQVRDHFAQGAAFPPTPSRDGGKPWHFEVQTPFTHPFLPNTVLPTTPRPPPPRFPPPSSQHVLCSISASQSLAEVSHLSPAAACKLDLLTWSQHQLCAVYNIHYRRRETGVKNPRDQRHRQVRFPHANIHGRPPPGYEPGSPRCEASSLTITPPRPRIFQRQTSKVFALYRKQPMYVELTLNPGTVFDTSCRRLAQSSPSTVTADHQCAVDIGTTVDVDYTLNLPLRKLVLFAARVEITSTETCKAAGDLSGTPGTAAALLTLRLFLPTPAAPCLFFPFLSRERTRPSLH
ncbi:hypothetical protein PR048_010613 [Dryococelus australis]|uniref:Uncharacterized protein n=1 Tax=Dryococelus australis TaxID=614101 RepID=A0ABQ9I394_9NEOP|nr:hypothetical protein PR048_010613 [Dryococelus australis]